jgi:hypothetical protein
MLAAQLLIARVPELRAARHESPVAAFDVLRGFPQLTPRPTRRREECFCSDAAYLDAYDARWNTAA